MATKEINVYEYDYNKLEKAAKTAGEDIATIMEWFVEEYMDAFMETLKDN